MIGKDVKRVCVCGTIYNLFFNLVIAPESELDKTVYLLQDIIPKSIADNFPKGSAISFPSKVSRISYPFFCFKYRVLGRWLYPYLDVAELYAQDHLRLSQVIIGRRNYNYTEDSSNCLEWHMKGEGVKKLWKYHDSPKNIWQKLYIWLFKPLADGIIGHNKYCKEIWVSGTENLFIPDYVSEKKVNIVDLQEAWMSASEYKKNYILSVFDLEQNDIELLKSKKKILFSQPLYPDYVTFEEHMEIYKKIISNYDLADLVIKTHPRDTVNYKKYFPGITVFDKKIPFQLLGLCGIKFEIAATVFSSSVYGIPSDIKVDWYGTKIHPKIEKICGDIKYKK